MNIFGSQGVFIVAYWIYLLTGHLILICVPRNTVAAPPILSVTLVFFGSCWMYVVLLAAIEGCSSSGAHGFVLHAFWCGGFMLGHSSSRRSTLCSWAIICLHSTFRSLMPPPHALICDIFDFISFFLSNKLFSRYFLVFVIFYSLSDGIKALEFESNTCLNQKYFRILN